MNTDTDKECYRFAQHIVENHVEIVWDKGTEKGPYCRWCNAWLEDEGHGEGCIVGKAQEVIEVEAATKASEKQLKELLLGDTQAWADIAYLIHVNLQAQIGLSDADLLRGFAQTVKVQQAKINEAENKIEWLNERIANKSLFRELGKLRREFTDDRRAALDWLEKQLGSLLDSAPGVSYFTIIEPRQITIKADLPESLRLDDYALHRTELLESYLAEGIRVLAIQSGHTHLPMPVSLIPQHPSDEEAHVMIRRGAELIDKNYTATKQRICRDERDRLFGIVQFERFDNPNAEVRAHAAWAEIMLAELGAMLPGDRQALETNKDQTDE